MKTWNQYVQESTQNYAYFLKQLKDYYNDKKGMLSPCVKKVVDFIKKNDNIDNFIIRFEGEATNNVTHVLLTDRSNRIIVDSLRDDKNIKTTDIIGGEYIVSNMDKTKDVMINSKMLSVREFLKVVE